MSVSMRVRNENSREVLIGKRLGVFEDMRLKPARCFGQNLDPGGLDHVSAELMLKLTAGNKVALPRKWIGAWEGVVPIKLWVVSNVVPNLNDPVLPTRFVKLAFSQSFLGREDVGLKAKLGAELPGIAQRCVKAYRRLRSRGRFVQPQTGLALKVEVEANSDPFAEFFNTSLVIDKKATVKVGMVFETFKIWAMATGNLALMKKIPEASKLSKALKKLPGLAGLETYKPEGKAREYIGLRLRTRDERESG